MNDLKGVVTDTETLLKDVADSTAEEFDAVRTKVEGHLGDARTRVANFRSQLGVRAKNAADATDGYVRKHPWQVIGVAAAAGLAASFFIKRR